MSASKAARKRMEERLAAGIPTPLGDLLRQAHQRLVGILDTALAEAGWDDVRSAHVSVLATVHPEGSRLTTMTELGGRTKQSVAELAGHLVSRGYLSLVPDPADGRAKLYQPTTRGYDLLAACERVVEDHDRWLQGTLGAREVDRLRRALHLVIGAQPGV